MTGPTLALAAWLALAPADPPAPHAANPVLADLTARGWEVDAQRVDLPPLTFEDGLTAEAERTALAKVAGSERAAADLTRDSVSAPVVLKTRDIPRRGGVVRWADLWFVVRADLDDVDPDRAAGGVKEGEPVEAANMRVEARRLGPDDLKAAGVPVPEKDARDWYVHSTGRLLDRLHVEATDRVTATRSAGSWLVATRTDPRFGAEGPAGNFWAAIRRQGTREAREASQPYPGGVGVVRVGRLASAPGALVVEAHFGFYEPRGWFDGAPVLRSKIGLVAQDRVRSLRRELAKSRRGEPARKAADPGAGGR